VHERALRVAEKRKGGHPFFNWNTCVRCKKKVLFDEKWKGGSRGSQGGAGGRGTVKRRAFKNCLEDREEGKTVPVPEIWGVAARKGEFAKSLPFRGGCSHETVRSIKDEGAPRVFYSGGRKVNIVM